MIVMGKFPGMYILMAGVCGGMNGFFFRHLSGYGLGAAEVLFLKVLFAMPLLGIYFLIKNRAALRVRLKDLLPMFCVGFFGLFLYYYCYFISLNHNSVAVTAALVYTSPIFVVIASALLFKEKITKQKAFALTVIVIGCAASAGIFSERLNVNVIGLLIGVCSGLLYGSYSIFGRFVLDRGYRGTVISFYSILITLVGAFFMADLNVITAAISAPMVLYSLGISFVCCLCPLVLFTVGLKKVETGTASMLVTSELVVSALSGLILLGEPLALHTAIGISLILLGILWMNRKPVALN